MFDEICSEHAKTFAKVCIHQYFQSVSGDMHSFHSQCGGDSKEDDDDQSQEEDKLLGIRSQEDINKVLWNWHISKPPLSLRKHDASEDADKKVNGSQNGVKTGYDNVTFIDPKGQENGYITPQNAKSHPTGHAHMNQHACNGYAHSPGIQKKEWAVYYSKV